MFIRRDLGWVLGFPVGGDEWLELWPGEPPRRHAMDASLTRRSTRAVNKLLRNFPRALPRVVGDVDDWATLHRALLATLKPTIHGGRPMPASPSPHHPVMGNSLKRRIEVIANIVDVNKLVLYARDETGRVVGRILVALTDAGGLRETRERGVRRWADEGDAYRLELAARAHLALHRPGQARDLYQLVLGTKCSSGWKRACRQAMEQVEAGMR